MLARTRSPGTRTMTVTDGQLRRRPTKSSMKNCCRHSGQLLNTCSTLPRNLWCCITLAVPGAPAVFSLEPCCPRKLLSNMYKSIGEQLSRRSVCRPVANPHCLECCLRCLVHSGLQPGVSLSPDQLSCSDVLQDVFTSLVPINLRYWPILTNLYVICCTLLRYFDKTGTGYLRVEDLRRIVHNLGAGLSHRSVKTLVQGVADPQGGWRGERVYYRSVPTGKSHSSARLLHA